jgi:hypothetical protein
MYQSILKDNKMKVYGCMVVILVLSLLIWWLLSSPRQEPLIKLTPEANNKFVSKGVRNIVFFDMEAQPIQTLDLTANQSPQVRDTTKNEFFLESPDASVDNPDLLKPLLPKDQVDSLLTREIPYIEYRNDKDQQLVVFELMEDGTCKTCKRATQGKGYLRHSSLSIQRDKHGLLDYVIKPVGAACSKVCADCDKSPNCKSPDGGCCNCKK